MMDTPQRSVFDMEKYLKKTDVSGSSDASLVHTTFDLTGWADHLNSSRSNPQKEPPKEQENSTRQMDDAFQLKTTTSDNLFAKANVSLNSTKSGNKSELKRSSIPRPRSSLNSQTKSSVGSGQSSTLGPQVETPATADFSANTFSDKNLNESGGRTVAVNPQASGITRTPLEKPENCHKSPARSPELQKSASGGRKGPTGLPCLKGSNLSSHMGIGLEQLDRQRNCPSPDSVIAFPLPSNASEKHVGFSCPGLPDGPASGQ